MGSATLRILLRVLLIHLILKISPKSTLQPMKQQARIYAKRLQMYARESALITIPLRLLIGSVKS